MDGNIALHRYLQRTYEDDRQGYDQWQAGY